MLSLSANSWSVSATLDMFSFWINHLVAINHKTDWDHFSVKFSYNLRLCGAQEADALHAVSKFRNYILRTAADRVMIVICYLLSEACWSGSYSENGLKPCRTCPIGTYQPDYGRTLCLPCGPGILTHSTGATGFQHCIVSGMIDKWLRDNCNIGRWCIVFPKTFSFR